LAATVELPNVETAKTRLTSSISRNNYGTTASAAAAAKCHAANIVGVDAEP
jgi:hypothetical protein